MTSSLFVGRDDDEDEAFIWNDFSLVSFLTTETGYLRQLLMFDVDRVMLMKGQGAGSNVSRCCSPATRVFFIGSGSTRNLQPNRKCFCAQSGAVHSFRVQTSSMKRPSKLKIVGQSVLIRKRSSHIWQREREIPPHSLHSILTQTSNTLSLGYG